MGKTITTYKSLNLECPLSIVFCGKMDYFPVCNVPFPISQLSSLGQVCMQSTR
jgi:hypothetical protein